jgi:hypothetical protein
MNSDYKCLHCFGMLHVGRSAKQADTLISLCGLNEPAYQEINVKFSAVKATTPRTVGQSNWSLAGMGTLSTVWIDHAGKGGSYDLSKSK